MIPRAWLARSVCLQCQLRLLDRPRAHSLLRIHPFGSESLQRRQYSFESFGDRLNETDHEEQEKDARRDSTNPSESFLKDEPSQVSAESPSGQSTIMAPNAASSSQNELESTTTSTARAPEKKRPLHYMKYAVGGRLEQKRIGNRRLYVEVQHLEGPQLGLTAQTIVMHEGKKREPRQLPVEESDPVEVPDILEEIKRGKQELTIEETLAHIDELRPSDSVLSRKDFDALLSVLLKGFTAAQLKAYLYRASSTALKPSPMNEVLEYSWIEESPSWTPLQKFEMTGLPKQRLGMVLMRKAWKVELREMLNGPGTYTVKAKQEFLALLTMDKKRLTSIRETYLDPGQKIHLSASHLRITANKAKTDTILQKLDEVFRDTIVQEFEARWIAGRGVDRRPLEHLGQLTNTVITYRASEHKIYVSWFKNDSADEGQERPDHVVHRLLHTAMYPRASSIALKFPEDTEGRLVPEALGRESLPWLDKLIPWSRWVAPISRVSSYVSDTPLEAQDFLPKPIEARPQEFDEPWSKPYTTTTASFGHILHKKTPDFSLEQAADENSHIFLPISPPPANLAALSDMVTSSEPVTSSLIFNFRPHSNTRKTISRNLPGLLELHLRIPDDLPEGPLSWHACSKRLIAVLGQNFTDIAYPSRPIDIRLSQPVQTTMSPSALDDSPFREYMESTKLDLLAGRVCPPPDITLSDLPSSTTEKTTSKPVKYMFTGLEMRRTLDVKYEAHRLHYTSVQAGHHGGQRAEMVLEATPAKASLSEQKKTAHAERYLRLVQDLANGGVVRWVGQRESAANLTTLPESG